MYWYTMLVFKLLPIATQEQCLSLNDARSEPLEYLFRWCATLHMFCRVKYKYVFGDFFSVHPFYHTKRNKMSIPTQGQLTNLNSDSHIHLALAQVLPATEDDSSSGFAKLSSFARQAAKEGADVVAFPEYFLTGATHDDWFGVRDKGGPLPWKEMEDQETHWVDEICNLAMELDLNIVAGTVVELGHHVPHRSDERQGADREEEQKLFNTAYFIGREGQVKGRYTKRVSNC